MSARPRVSLCMIVRNEEKNLHDALTPVAPLVDEVVVIDTGSTDGTRQEAERLGARVFEFPWCDDFSAARNESLVRATGDWAFWLDADDRLDADNLLKLRALFDRLGEGPGGYFMHCVCAAKASTDPTRVLAQCRLFERRPEVRWERRVHEQITPSIERAGRGLALSDVRIQHTGYEDAGLLHRKANRDLRLLRLDHATDPTDPATLFNLGLAYLRLGQPGEALTYLLTALKYAKVNADWVAHLYETTCQTLYYLNRLEEALAVATEGLWRFPADPALSTRRASFLAQVGQFGEAERCLLTMLRAPAAPRLASCDQTMLDRREPRFLLASIYLDQGRWAEAKQTYQELLAEHPAYVEAWVGLGCACVSEGRDGEVEYVARQLEKCDHGPIFAAVLRAKALVARGQTDDARLLLDWAIARAPRLPWARVVLGDCLLKGGASLEDCIAAQRDILRVSPGQVPALTLLRRLEQQQKNVDPSSLCFSVTTGD